MVAIILALGTLVLFVISTIQLHASTFITPPYQTRSNSSSGGNHTTTATATTTEIHPQVVFEQAAAQQLFDPDKIPTFMKDYFDWHGEQLRQIQEDAVKADNEGSSNDDDNDFLSKYRFLVLRCAAGNNNNNKEAVEDRCGGLSDRLKPFPLFLWYAATTNRILFIRWGKNRPAVIETFMKPGSLWNWTVPDVLLHKIEKLEEVNINNSRNINNFTRLYFDGSSIQHKLLRERVADQAVWMVEGNDFTGGATRYKTFVETAIKMSSSSSPLSPSPSLSNGLFSPSKLRPTDAVYANFYHDLFHATFRPSSGVELLLSAYFNNPNNNYNNNNENERYMSGEITSWLPVPLQRNQYAVAHYRAKYPKEPYRETQNRTVLRETTIHAVECAKSRVSSTIMPKSSNVMNSTATIAGGVSAVYVASDTGE